VDQLEYAKTQRGVHMQPLCLFFTDTGVMENPRSTLNFSRVDEGHLEITTLQVTEFNANICAISTQSLRVMSGMGGLQFSK
jgi:hypothetical protein